jgi:inner membrane protein
LSISEYTGFNTAYLIAAAATVSLIGLYVLSIFRQLKIAAGFTLALGGLYTYLFILIQLQDYALLGGSIGLFVILSVIMYFSRKIDWYNTSK